MCITIGEDCLEHVGNAASALEKLSTVKMYLNIATSLHGAKHMTNDTKDFIHGSPIEHPDYEHSKLYSDLVPEEIIEQC